MSDGCCKKFAYQAVLNEELARIAALRKNRGITEKVSADNLAGIAISGGGIRSAAFSLGVLQALVKRDVLKWIDYLSTVSGGGYTGSSLTWFLHDKWEHNGAPVRYGVDKDNFPFGQSRVGARTDGIINSVLDFIRQHGNYMDPGKCLNAFSLIAVILRSIILGLMVYFPLIFAVIFALVKGKAFENVSAPAGAEWLAWMSAMNLPVLCAVLLFAIFVVFSLGYSVMTRLYKCLGKDKERATGIFDKPYMLRMAFQCLAGVILAFCVGLLLIGGLPLVKAKIAAWAAGGSTALGALGAVVKFIIDQKQKEKGEGVLGKLLVWGASFLLIYGLLLLAYVFADAAECWLWPVSTVILSLTTGLLVNLNYVSLHRVYRDRLMETFLPDIANVRSGQWGPATGANAGKLKDMCGPGSAGPYHIINTNIVLIDSLNAKFRGRGGDNFILSSLFCGSDATGWFSTAEFSKGEMTIASAMAVSGAAVNPHTGVAGAGPTRNRLLSFLMTMMNLRLGYWASNPAKSKKTRTPNYFCPGLNGLLGTGFKEDGRFIELSDGGHFDNTGLYELIRRKVKVIIMVDGSADLNCTFADLGNMIGRARVDFGTDIRFEEDLHKLLPGTAGGDAFNEKLNLSARGYAVGSVEYPDGTEGKIYYINTVLTPGLPVDIYSFKSANKTFPDQSTTDQFFDETQFEAYRELGYRLALNMVDESKSLIEHLKRENAGTD
ncbi:MAG: hypothetical protein HZA16_12830 [Nitrospirae bacterium]|nr:hypothetical protein [Nitrospirota bacterium]